MNKYNEKGLTSVYLEDEMKKSYLDYAMSVIVSRAIPDVRDGLKPVHRRILYSMYESGYHYDRQYKKSARVVGDVIGKYHPHGETAIYDSLVRMAQVFSLRAPLIDGQGNFGSIDGDPAAAMRYTESRLAKISHSLIKDIDNETVDFIANYDGSEVEPSVLPAMFPNILVNGSGGIAVGMATNIPPHNLAEVLEACCLYIDNNGIEVEELMKVIKGPDFPTGGTILGVDGIKSAYLTGRGTITVKGKAKLEVDGKRQNIVITEIPYTVNKVKLVERIIDLVKEKRIDGISDIRDESSKAGMRILVEIKRDAFGETILKQLYAYTPLQVNLGIIMLALKNSIPCIMNLKEIIKAFVDFRESTIIRRTNFLMSKAKQKAHTLLGLRVAVNNIEQIVSILRAAKDVSYAKDQLMKTSYEVSNLEKLVESFEGYPLAQSDKYHLTEIQAKAILDMKLQRFTAIEKDKLDSDLSQLEQEIKYYLGLLSSREVLLEHLKDELIKIKDDFATPRLTDVEQSIIKEDSENLIQREDMVMTVTLEGYVKRVPLVTYKVQKRGGKGRLGLSMYEEDITTEVFVGSTHTTILFFSNLGKVYSLKLYKLPLGTPQSKGKPIVNILPLSVGENITSIMPLPDEYHNQLNIVFVTNFGSIRKNRLLDFSYISSSGKIAVKLKGNEKLVGVKVCKEEDHILLATKRGKAIRFSVSSIRLFKSRSSTGVRGIKLTQGDVVISLTILQGAFFTKEERSMYLTIPLNVRVQALNDKKFDLHKIPISLGKDKFLAMAMCEELILTISENGFGKKSSSYEYRVTNRGGSGVVNMSISSKTGYVIDTIPVSMLNEIMLITNKGKLIRCKLDTVRVTGRSTSGVILFKTDSEEKVVSTCLVDYTLN